MNEKKELQTLINRPWFWRMRGGAQLRMVKEGTDKESARSKVKKHRLAEGDNHQKAGNLEGKPKPGCVKEVECIVFVPPTPGSRLSVQE